MEFKYPPPVREPKLIYDAFFAILTSDFVPNYPDDKRLAPRGLPREIKVIPLKPDSGGMGNISWSGFAFYSCKYLKKECDCCGTGKVLRSYGIASVPHFGIMENAPVEDFIPCDSIFVPQRMKDILENSGFRGFEMIRVESVDNHQLDGWQGPDLYMVKFTGAGADREFWAWLHREYPDCCKTCGWGPITCPKCEGSAVYCPQCGPKRFVDGVPSGIDWPDPDPMVNEIIRGYWVTYPYFGKVSDIAEKTPALCGEQWDGSDFVREGRISGGIVSGRVAKWLIDNQYGPALLAPYPLDISRCSPEQLEAIEKIRYRD